MDEDTLERLLQLGLARWRNPNLFLVLIIWLVQLFDAVFPTNAEFERRYEDRTGGTPAGSQSQSHGQSQSHKKPAPEDPFVTLGLAPKGEGVDLAAVNKAYRALALKWHPDKNGQSEESLAMMQTLNAAKAACLQHLSPAEREEPLERDEDEEDPSDADAKDEAAYQEYQRQREAEMRKVQRERARAQRAKAGGSQYAEVEQARCFLPPIP